MKNQQGIPNQSEILIYTIGHSSRHLKEFVEILRTYNIEAIADVRRFPTSRKFPHFSREILQSLLSIFEIEYYWLGKELGGFRSGGYEKYIDTPEFLDGINKLLNLARKKVVAIMCAESLWFRCHRRFIADYLVRKNVEVIHIFDKRRATPHKLKDDNNGKSKHA